MRGELTMFTAKCPNCGKSIVKQDFENKEKICSSGEIIEISS